MEVRITGQIKERGDNVVIFGEKSKSLKDYLDVLRRARDDKDVKTVIIRLTGPELGLGMAQELRAAIRDTRDKGKKTIAASSRMTRSRLFSWRRPATRWCCPQRGPDALREG